MGHRIGRAQINQLPGDRFGPRKVALRYIDPLRAIKHADMCWVSFQPFGKVTARHAEFVLVQRLSAGQIGAGIHIRKTGRRCAQNGHSCDEGKKLVVQNRCLCEWPV